MGIVCHAAAGDCISVLRQGDFVKRIFSFLVIFVLSFTAFAELKYIEIGSIKNAPTVQIKSIEDFEAIISTNKIATAYLHKESDSLLVIAENTYFSFAMNGYFTLADYKNGNSLNYKNGTDYNEAKTLVLADNSEIYYFYKRNEFKSVADCRDAYKNGFCFEKEKTVREERRTAKNATEKIVEAMNRVNSNLIYGAIKNFPESDAYYKAKELGYSNYSDYYEYLDFTAKGFKSKEDMQTAIAQGFFDSEKSVSSWVGAVATDFYTAQENRFPNREEYVNAKDKNLTTYADWKKYQEITATCDKIAKSQNTDKGFALLYYQIQTMQKSEMSLSVLSKTLQEDFKSVYSENLGNALKRYGNVKIQNQNNSIAFQNRKKVTLKQDGTTQKIDTSDKSETEAKKTPFRENLFEEEILKSFFKDVNISQIGSYNEKTEIFKRK